MIYFLAMQSLVRNKTTPAFPQTVSVIARNRSFKTTSSVDGERVCFFIVYPNPKGYTDPDGRSDERYRFSGTDFESDEFGQQILLHYLLGKGEPLIIENESNWSRYMKASERLKGIVSSKLFDILKNIDTNSVTNVDFTFQGFVDNGESITGYNYLHGTVESEGDFHITGTILRLEDGSFINALTFTWNDTIDPNYIYITDQIKSRIANILSLGQAANYKIKIEWFSLSEISSDGQVKGWPFE